MDDSECLPQQAESILLLLLEAEPELAKGKDLTPPEAGKLDLDSEAFRMIEENCDFIP